MRPLLLLMAIAVTCGTGANAAQPEAGKLISPPPIYLPDGGKILLDVNAANADLLGLAKQLLPMLSDLAKAAAAQEPAGSNPDLDSLASLDLKPLVEALGSVTNVRVVIAQYGGSRTGEQILRLANKGISKAGKFAPAVAQSTMLPGGLELFAEPGDQGYLAFGYDDKQRILLAVRVVGFLDMPKIMQWALQSALSQNALSLTGGTPAPAPVQEEPSAP